MKKATIGLTVLLIFSLIFCGTLILQLGNAKNQLSTTTAQLATTQQQLDTTKTELTSTKMQMADTQAKFTDSENNLKTTAAQLDTTKNQLDETNSQLSTTQAQLDTAKNENTQMLDQYTNLRAQINLRFGWGEDCEKYTTPDDPQVAAKAKEVAGSYAQDINEVWRDYQRLYEWVTKNIEYSYDSYVPLLPETLGSDLKWNDEYWRMPAETLQDKHGDCEDMAALLASLMSSYNNKQFRVWATVIKNEDQGHVAVTMPVKGNKLAVLDPAGNYYTGYQDDWLQSYDTSRAISDWLSRWAEDIPDAKIVSVFSYDFYKEFANTQEFIDWVKSLPD